MDYQAVLDDIFKTYLVAKPQLCGRPDRDTRAPLRLVRLGKKLDILPQPENTIIVTGSKGKGSCARLIAKGLQNIAPHAQVGLVTSPELQDHNDRMKINDEVISKKDFCRHYERIKPHLSPLDPPAYYSPYGLFLLIALSWFRERACDYWVIETGRGVRFDEGGQIEARLGVVTSVFFEHATYIGPTLKDIRADKLSLKNTCAEVVLGRQVLGKEFLSNGMEPAWISENHRLATEALQRFLKKPDVSVLPCPLPSFARKETADGTILYYEAMISRESADWDFLKGLISFFKDGIIFYLNLPDDKDVEGIVAGLQNLGAKFEFIKLTGERGLMTYEKTPKAPVLECPFNNSQLLKECLTLEGVKVAYFIGPQTYIRLVREAFFK